MLDLGRFKGRILATRQVPPRPANLVALPAGLHPELQGALRSVGLQQLYSHQAETFSRAVAGENVVLTTGTASGKSLAYLLPVLQAVLENPARRAILLFPTKALGQDQLRALLDFVGRFGERQIEAGVYDGDTPPAERTRIRERANLILTNPDMLNAGLIPQHGRRGYSHIFRHVRYLVIDELHTYRGAFGAHFANLMRRLRRICAHYGSQPQFLASSATIANPRELAETLCGGPFSLVEQDGSPSAGKTIHFWLPPLTDPERGLRRGVVQEMAQLLPQLVQQRQRFIAFCRSRKETEVVLKESRDQLGRVDGGHDDSALLAGYRGGYTPEERRTVARQLQDGQLLGVVSTNALELGIDIGALQVVVQAGFPGTRASFWQQIGRAGRRGTVSQAVVLLAMTPHDQFIGQDPDWLLNARAEHAVCDPDNLMVQLAHVRAAAAELPLRPDDVELFPDLGEIVPVLGAAGELTERGGTYHWCGGPYPAGDFSLRNIDPDRYKIVNRLTGTTITEMDRPQTYREAFPRAVYLHDGIQHLVETLDHVGRVATVVPVEQDYYTEPDVRTKIDVLLTQGRRELGQTRSYFGDVRVDSTTVGYKMLQFHNHQNLGYEGLDPTLTVQLETEAVWLPVPAAVHAYLAEQATDLLSGMVHALGHCARMKTMAEASDLVGTSFHHADEETGESAVSLILHDSHPGGLGYAARAHEQIADVLRNALALVERCACRDGCPACVGDDRLDRRLVAWGLRSLLEVVPPPPSPERSGRRPAPAPGGAGPAEQPLVAAPRLELAALPDQFSALVARLQAAERPGAGVLAQVTRVEVHGRRLVLQLRSPGLAQWLELPGTRQPLLQELGRHVALPDDLVLELRVDEAGREQAAARTHKLRRRHDDLTRKP